LTPNNNKSKQQQQQNINLAVNSTNETKEKHSPWDATNILFHHHYFKNHTTLTNLCKLGIWF